MKKALSVFLMTALAFGAFAQDAEPVADVNIAEFSGNAAVQWGVDLDSGTTGFKNSYEVNLKLNLLNNGSKSTTGDGVWGELVLKTDDDTFIGWTNGGDRDEMGDKLIGANNGMNNETLKEAMALKVFVDTAKIHIGPAYIGIKRGDTQTGELKMDATIRSADDDQSKWLGNVGPDNYNHGIVLGMDTDVVKVDLDLRSYSIAAKLEENGNYNAEENQQKIAYQYTDAYAAALEAELKGDGIGVEGLSVKGGVSFNFAENYYPGRGTDGLDGWEYDENGPYAEWKKDLPTDARMLGYSASVGYKLGLDDTFYVRPQVGFTGQIQFYKDDDTKTSRTKTDKLAIAAGLLFGWGEIGMDQDAGVYYLDDDHAKKVSPGVGVVAYIPLPGKTTTDVDGSKTSATTYTELIRIMPSFYSGELIPGLTAAAYADIGVTKLAKDDNEGPDTVDYIREEAKVPMAFALGAQYAIEAGEVT
ncbi:MAG: hypothetical protein IJC31_00875, partial [Spirochaetaceae bacterium]|nr:hypothetical protein [Spirochaetaceae bacterium]